MSFHNLATGLRLLGGDGGISANEACEHTTQSLLRGSSWKGTDRDLTWIILGDLGPIIQVWLIEYPGNTVLPWKILKIHQGMKCCIFFQRGPVYKIQLC